MIRQLLAIFSIIILLTIVTFPFVSSSDQISTIDNNSVIKRYDSGWLKEIDGVTVVYLKGSHYEMGYQYGSLVGEKCLQSYRAFIYFSQQAGITYENLLKKWEYKKQFVSKNHLDEMQGIADAIGVTIEYVAIGNFANARSFDRTEMDCINFVCLNPSTSDGKMYHGYSYDFHMKNVDPVTGINIVQENQILLIHDPDDGYAHIGISVAGYIIELSGLNEFGLAISSSRCWSHDESDTALNTGDTMKYALENCYDAQEAVNLFSTNKTKGLAYIISDAKTEDTYVVEVNANLTYVGTWNSPVESNPPFWEIDHVLRRANLYLNKTLSKTEREIYNPKSIFLWILGKNYYYPFWRHYRALSIGIQKNWGNLNHKTMMEILKKTYNGNYDIMFFFATRLRLLESWYQWVICPETGDMWYKIAGNGYSAFNNQIHYVNFYDLLT